MRANMILVLALGALTSTAHAQKQADPTAILIAAIQAEQSRFDAGLIVIDPRVYIPDQHGQSLRMVSEVNRARTESDRIAAALRATVAPREATALCAQCTSGAARVHVAASDPVRSGNQWVVVINAAWVPKGHAQRDGPYAMYEARLRLELRGGEWVVVSRESVWMT